MNERIRDLRILLSLNQTKFGERIGVKQSTVTGYETGSRIPLDPVILSICRVFNVNETWLRTGAGNMFNEIESDEFSVIAAQIDLRDPQAKQAIIDYWHLSNSDKQKLWDFVDTFIKY